MNAQKSESVVKPLFPVGQTVATPGAIALLGQHGISAFDLLHRHAHGDWGDLPSDDMSANSAALKNGNRLLSAYRIGPFGKVSLITEHDRSVTTILLSSDY